MALGSFALSSGFDMLFYAVSDAACHAAQGGSDNHLQKSADHLG
jgi:hypothetical protein